MSFIVNPPATSSGQTSYDAIVPDDYSTPEAAIAAGKVNIYVKNGSYSHSGNVSTSSTIRITGQSHAAIIALAGTNMTFTGHDIVFRNLKVTADNGYLRFDGNRCIIDECYIEKSASGTGSMLRYNSEYARLTNSKVVKLNSTAGIALVAWTKIHGLVENNVFELRDIGSTIATAGLSGTSNSYNLRIVGNRFLTDGTNTWSTNGYVVGLTKADCQVESNYFENLTGGATAVACDDYNLVLAHNRCTQLTSLFKATGSTTASRSRYQIIGNMVMEGHIDMSGCQRSSVISNYISKSSGTTAMTWTTAVAIMVSNNYMRNCGLTLDTNSTGNIVVNNVLARTSGSFAYTITDNGTGNTVTPNTASLGTD